MPELLAILLLTLGAALAMPLGALLARVERIQPRWLEREVRHAIVAFGGGALLSAVALVLVPDGLTDAAPVPAVLCLVAGGAAFMALDMALSRSQARASQLAAMLSDFVPEALALGQVGDDGCADDRSEGLYAPTKWMSYRNATPYCQRLLSYKVR